MYKLIQWADIAAFMTVGLIAFLIMFLSASVRGISRDMMIKKSFIFSIAFLVFAYLAVAFLSWIYLSDFSLRTMLFNYKNIRRLPRVLLNASLYMFVVWKQKTFYALRNGFVFTTFSFLTFPFFERFFDLCGL